MSIILDRAYNGYIAAVGGREGSLLVLYTYMLQYSIWNGNYQVGNMLTFDDIHSSNGLSC